MGEAIAKGILKTLGIAIVIEVPKAPEKKITYAVQVGAYINKANAEAQVKRLKNAGFEGYIVKKRG